MALVGLALARDLAGQPRRSWRRSAVAAASALVTLLLVFSRRPAALAARSDRAAAGRACSMPGSGCSESIRRYASHHGSWPTCSPARSPCRCSASSRRTAWDAGSASTLPLTAYFAFIPLILLVMLLPVTFNGIGTSQAAFVWFFARAGVPAASGVRPVGALRRRSGSSATCPAGSCTRSVAASGRERYTEPSHTVHAVAFDYHSGLQ